MTATWFVSFLLFFLPFIVFPIQSVPLEVGKVFVFECIVYALLFLAWRRSLNWQRPHMGPAVIPFIGLFVLSLIAYMLEGGETAFFGNIYRLQGVFLLWHLLIFALLGRAAVVPSWVPVLSYVGLAVSGYMMRSTETTRWVGTLGEPNAYAAATIALWPFVYEQLHHRPGYVWVQRGLVLGTGLLVWASGSQAGIVAFGLQCFVLFGSWKRIALHRVVGIAIVIMLLSLVLPFFDARGELEDRATIWHTAWVAGLQKPLLGYGFGNIQYGLIEAGKILQNGLRFEPVDSAHNILLDYWVQGGATGVFFLVWLIWDMFKILVRQKHTLHLVVCIGVCTTLLFNPGSIVTLVHFWWLLGKGASMLTDVSGIRRKGSRKSVILSKGR